MLTAIGQFDFSPMVESDDVTGRGPAYVNVVAIGVTRLALDELLSRLKAIERLLGRTPESKLRGVVEADVDLVIWNGEVLRPKDAARDYFLIPYNLLKTPGDGPRR
jgi:2-amino-4-hydroxy-6-hydroxymethyldihydropteridine diphosphokinase